MSARQPAYSTGSVTSLDGTTIGYRRIGAGPMILLVHGGMMSSQNLMRLGGSLSDAFSVCIPDRRGRGLSGPYGAGFSLDRAAQDIEALVDATGARNLFAVSVGGLPVLRWAITCPAQVRIALYEPPLPIHQHPTVTWLSRYDRELASGRPAAALVTIAKGTKDSWLTGLMPRAVLVPLMRIALRAQARETAAGDTTLADLIPTMHDDARLVLDATDLLQETAQVRAEVLLLGGSRSAAHLKDATAALHATLRRSRRLELRGLGHLAPDNGGAPETIASVLREFFGSARTADDE